MKLENQVCSLELAQKLKSLGVEQESHFKWHILDPNFGVGKLKVKLYTEQEWNDYAEDNLPEDADEEFYSAFTVAELVELLTVAKTDILVALPDINANRLAKCLIEIYETRKN